MPASVRIISWGSYAYFALLVVDVFAICCRSMTSLFTLYQHVKLHVLLCSIVHVCAIIFSQRLRDAIIGSGLLRLFLFSCIYRFNKEIFSY